MKMRIRIQGSENWGCYHNRCLGFSARKSLRSKVLDRYFATMGAALLLPSKYLNRTSLPLPLKFTIFNVFSTATISSFLRGEYTWQCSRKCFSSSIDKQKGHFLSFITKFKCLPFSIIRLWLDRRNFVIEVLSFRFFTFSRYGSILKSFLMRL